MAGTVWGVGVGCALAKLPPEFLVDSPRGGDAGVSLGEVLCRTKPFLGWGVCVRETAMLGVGGAVLCFI